jgi:23S rRNA pseudouridine1911/1915/1917 synthase
MQINKEVEAQSAGRRIDLFIRDNFPDLPRPAVQEALRRGEVTVNGRPVKPGFRIRENDRVAGGVVRPERGMQAVPERIPLKVVFKDRHIIIVNKPWGMAVHPGAGRKHGTLVNGLLYYYRKGLSTAGGPERPGIVHRIDKDTSGLVMVARNDKIHARLSDMFRERSVKKTYRAVVWGRFSGERTIDRPISRSRSNPEKMVVDRAGRPAVTQVTGGKSNGWLTEVIVRPETGRTHQIRVHLSSIGHPVLGDQTYGGGKQRLKSTAPLYLKAARALCSTLDRFMLHAEKLEFIHPIARKKTSARAPLPKDMKEVLSAL